MANFKVKDKKIIPEFVGSLMKAIARGGAKKTIKKLEKDPVIRKSVANIKKIDKDFINIANIFPFLVKLILFSFKIIIFSFFC